MRKAVFVFYGYFLKGTGSAIYARELTRAFNKLGVDVFLFSQEDEPESFDFIEKAYEVDLKRRVLKERFTRETSFPGKTYHFRPDLQGFLPVYVFDSYVGYSRIQTFDKISKAELKSYSTSLISSLDLIFKSFKKEPLAVLYHHLVPLPFIFKRYFSDLIVPRFAVYHGSDLNFAIKKSKLMDRIFKKSLSDLSGIITLTEAGRKEVESYLGAEFKNIHVINPGIDFEIFYPRTNKQAAFKEFQSLLVELPVDLEISQKKQQLISSLARIDDAVQLRKAFEEIERLEALKQSDPELKEFVQRNLSRPLILFAGKYLWTKGAAALLLSMPYVWKEIDEANLILVGFGATRGILEKLRLELSQRNLRAVVSLLEKHREIDPGSAEDLIFDAPLIFAERLKDQYFALDYLSQADFSKFLSQVKMAGYLDHKRLAPLMSLADIFVAPSLFKESFGLVLIEAAASGTLPLGSCHSGFKDVLDYYSQQLGFEKENLCLSLNDEFIKELGNKIIWALELSKEKDKLAKNLFELTRKTFSWESAARNLLHLF